MKNKKFIENLKDYIALSIVVFTFLVLITLIILNYTSANFQQSKDITSLFLPIVGTWMGTVLAFYFSRENFESASKSLQQTISILSNEEKLKEIKSITVMIPVNNIKHPFTSDRSFDSLSIDEAINFMKSEKVNRLVVMDPEKKVKFVIHKSLIDEFIRAKILEEKMNPEDLKNITIRQMYDTCDARIKEKIDQSVDYISEDSFLIRALDILNNNSYCQDIFVTKTGKKNEEVSGWITNIIVSENIRGK